MRKLFKHIGMICLALAVAVGSFFVPIRKPNRSQMASADSAQQNFTFTGSNIYLPIRYDGSGRYFISLKSKFYFDDSVGMWAFNFNESKIYRLDGYSIVSYDVYTNSSLTSTIIHVYGMGSVSALNLYVSSSISFDVGVGLTRGSSSSDNSSFNGDVYKIGFDSSTHSSGDYNFNYVRYYDINDNYLYVYFKASIIFAPLEDRTYFISSTFTDEQIYQEGYWAGVSSAQNESYNNGYNAGYDDGKSVGKTEGIAEANDYSFISLFGGLFDAPVAMLMGLLTFDFLGINLWAFVTSLFTLALVLFIVKLIMGR